MSSNIIKFVHEDQITEVKNPDPNETLLNYIRTNLKKTGTKEGCAEGGCGACTVVLGELKNNQVNYSAVNSCIMFLPTLQGKHSIVFKRHGGDNSAAKVLSFQTNNHLTPHADYLLHRVLHSRHRNPLPSLP